MEPTWVKGPKGDTLGIDRRGFWGIVLAGAYPRGRSVFDLLLPRPLLPVVETPVVAYPLRWLAQGGVANVTVCANSSARGVRGLLQGLTGPGLSIDFSEDWMPRGAAGCVRDAAIRTSADTFIVVDGTTLPQLDMEALVCTHRRLRAALTVSARPKQGGGGDSFLSPNGIYVFDRRAIDHIADHGFQDIKEALIPTLHAAGEEIAFHECSDPSPRVFDAASYLSVNRWAISRLADPVTTAEMSTKGYHLREEAFVHMSSQVSPHARLVGPLVVGPGVTVEDRATIVGPAAIGRGSLVAQGAVVSRSVLWGHCRLGRESLVDDCLVSDGALVPARTSRYRALETARLGEEEMPLHLGSWASSRVQAWVESILPPRKSDPPRRPVGGRAPAELSHVERVVAIGRSQG
jgi:mannose-1-phosphate guanylyltransferase